MQPGNGGRPGGGGGMQTLAQMMAALGGAIASSFEATANKIIYELRRQIGALGMRNESIFGYVFSGDNSNGFVDLGAIPGVQKIGTFRVDEDGDFIGVRAMHFDVDPATGVPIAAPSSYTIQIVQSGADRNLQNFPVPIDSWAGDGKQCVPWGKTMLLPRSASIRAEFANLRALDTRAIVTILGFKVYDRAQLDELYRR